jgi:DNA-binding MltR family transcriptional regulator
MFNIDKAVGDLAWGLVHQRRMTHSGIVIAAAAILDEHLGHALKRAMQPLSTRMYERLFDSLGPLSTFSNKIAMARALDIVSAHTFQELEKIRKLRNAFAHSSELLNFSSPQIVPLLRALRVPPNTKQSPEEVFMACVSTIDAALEEYLVRMGERLV